MLPSSGAISTDQIMTELGIAHTPITFANLWALATAGTTPKNKANAGGPYVLPNDWWGYTHLVCNLHIDNVVTTDPTNLAADNGTATIVYSGGHGQVSYSINGGSFTNVSSSPINLTGLSASTSYNLLIKDDIVGCQATTSIVTGVTSFYFDADYMMLTYEFDTGQDLDTRTRMVTPEVGQDTNIEYVGWNKLGVWPGNGDPVYETWGGDNQGTGFESVLFDITNFRTAFPTYDGDIVIDARAFWFVATGTTPVNIQVKLWKGGTPEKSGFLWTNDSATSTTTFDSPGILLSTAPHDGQDHGHRIATFTYNLSTKIGTLNNNDTTTPEIV